MNTTAESTPTSSALTESIRKKWDIVQSQWIAMPATLQKVWAEVGDRLRTALDLPSKEEMAKLASRLDEIDARIAALVAPAGAKTAARTTADKRVTKK